MLKKQSRIPAVLLGAIIIGFFMWLIIVVVTMNIEVSPRLEYSLPDFGSLKDLYQPSSGEYAVAVDGNIAISSENINKRPTASTAKMILGLAIMKEKPFSLGESGEIITIDQEMYNKYLWYVANGGSVTKVELGEEISEYDALMSVFLASSNNMADTLAIWAFGSLENYKEYAEQMLRDLGIENTTIGPDASGFNPETVSTTEDLAKIGFYLLRNPVLREIVGTKSYNVPVAGLLINTNSLLGSAGIIGIKTGWIGEASGYCLVIGYLEGEHIITIALLNSPSRANSFNDSLNIAKSAQDIIKEVSLLQRGKIIGYYDTWWAGRIAIRTVEELNLIGWTEAEKSIELIMDGRAGKLRITVSGQVYEVVVEADEYQESPNLFEKIQHIFGWEREKEIEPGKYE